MDRQIFRMIWVGIFAVAMAWVESAIVLYLRALVDRMQPYQPDPLPHFGGLGGAEIIREAATLVMLLAVGLLAGRTWKGGIGFAAFAFGIWDIAYYIFLVPLTGWPNSLMDWDILFLIPLPWWGPVIAPVSIALMMIAGGGAAAWMDLHGIPIRLGKTVISAGALGIALALLAFMFDAVTWLMSGKSDALGSLLPEAFAWQIFLPALALMAIPVLRIWRQAAALARVIPEGMDPIQGARSPEGTRTARAANPSPPFRLRG